MISKDLYSKKRGLPNAALSVLACRGFA